MLNELEKELSFAHSLLKKFFGLEFDEPTSYRLYTGTDMIYDDDFNRIFIPDMVLPKDHHTNRQRIMLKAHRIFGLSHENTHAFICQRNHQLKKRSIEKLIKSKEMTKVCVFRAFEEGMANFLTIRSCLMSNGSMLQKRGECEHQELLDRLEKITSSTHCKILAKVFNLGECQWQKVILAYYNHTPEGLLAHLYPIGYWFARQVIIPENIVEIVDNPPQTMEHLIYPETYLEYLENLKP